MVNGNYKTFVKKDITDDKYLTLIGAIGAIGNGCTRFFWNSFFGLTHFNIAVSVLMVINIVVYATILLTVTNR